LALLLRSSLALLWRCLSLLRGRLTLLLRGGLPLLRHLALLLRSRLAPVRLIVVWLILAGLVADSFGGVCRLS
jgi:hypothetical protein